MYSIQGMRKLGSTESKRRKNDNVMKETSRNEGRSAQLKSSSE
jgi:hypothetical protein